MGDPSTIPSTPSLRAQLRGAHLVLSMHGLRIASKWAAEQLIGLPDGNGEAHGVGGGSFEGNEAAPMEQHPESLKALQASIANTSDRFLLAKNYFDLGECVSLARSLAPAAASCQRCCRVATDATDAIDATNATNNNNKTATTTTTTDRRRRYQRAASVLETADGQSTLNGLPSEELFLKAYALYLAGTNEPNEPTTNKYALPPPPTPSPPPPPSPPGEKLKEQEILELKDPLERSKVKNSFLKVGVTSATPTTPPPHYPTTKPSPASNPPHHPRRCMPSSLLSTRPAPSTRSDYIFSASSLKVSVGWDVVASYTTFAASISTDINGSLSLSANSLLL